MDIMLRARHDALVREFPCASTEFRVVKTPPGSAFRRTIDAFCTDSRAAAFGRPLMTYDGSCAGCAYLQLQVAERKVIDETESETAAI